MKYTEFIREIKGPVFSIQDVKLLGLNIYSRQLSLWANEGHIVKLKNGVYLISERKDIVSKEHIAFVLYQPSYISLEWALSHYGIIPEIVHNVTAITSKVTRTFENELGAFIYRNIKNTLFFGYKKIDDGKGVYLLAEPEKALLDYLYLNLSKINNKDDIYELRFNRFSIDEVIDERKLYRYAKIFGSKKLDQMLAFVMEK